MNSVGGYTFSNVELLETALTHSSYSKQNYERLEFLGDSILDFLIAKHFYFETKDKEGQLTKKRAYFVSEKHLNMVFDDILSPSLILLGKSCLKLTSSIKCDVVEAILGAIYIDSGIEECEKFIKTNFRLDMQVDSFVDYKSQLQEYAQANKIDFEYKLKQQQGQAHNPCFVFECVCGKYSTTQNGTTKQEAQQKCAKQILEMITKEQI